MNCHFQRSEEARTKNAVYALPADFCEVFDEHVDSLYALALLLTADHHKADQCFVAGLENCLQGGPVFREWVRSWARRTVVKNAIRMIAPRSETTAAGGKPAPSARDHAGVEEIMSLPPFDRFVYVLSVLERNSDRECAMLLDCTVRQVVDARTKALRQLVGVAHRESPPETVLAPAESEFNQSCGEML